MDQEVKNNDDVYDIISERKVREVMRASHTLYSKCFALAGRPLMLSEIQDRIPSARVVYKEIAGMTTTAAADD